MECIMWLAGAGTLPDGAGTLPDGAGTLPADAGTLRAARHQPVNDFVSNKKHDSVQI
jgi:X-X-X-Leu-X-X-Gly heptad repeat protein